VSVASGAAYVVPGNGTITSWSTNANNSLTQSMTFKVFRKAADPTFFKVVGLDGPRTLKPSLLNSFSGLDIPVQAGDLIGGHPLTGANLVDASSGDVFIVAPVDLTLADQGASFSSSSAGRLNLSAEFVPSNKVTVGKTALNKKKGTATLSLTLPNPGDLSASGKGVKASSAGAVTSKAVPGGPAQLVIKAKGKQRQTLDQTGKVTLNVTINYTPTGGELGTESVKVKLKKTG
jgi:hypothetical protein